MKKIFAILVASLLAAGTFIGCATSTAVSKINVKEYLGEGFDSFEGRLYKISGSGNVFDSASTVHSETMKRAGLETYERGYTYFAVITNNIQERYSGHTDIHADVDYRGNVTVSGGDAIYKPSGEIYIYMFNSIEELYEVGGEEFPYYKATTFYNPERDGTSETVENYHHKLQVGIGYPFLDNAETSGEVEYNYIFNKFALGLQLSSAVYSFEETKYYTIKSEYSGYTSNWDYNDSTMYSLIGIGIPIKYYFIPPKTHGIISLDVGITPGVLIQYYNKLFHTQASEYEYPDLQTDEGTNVGFLCSFKGEVDFNINNLALGIFGEYNLNTFSPYFNIGANLIIYFK